MHAILLTLVILLGAGCRAKETRAEEPASVTAGPSPRQPSATRGADRACLGLPEASAQGDACRLPRGVDGPGRGESVLGTDLAVCSTDPLTGFFRDGRCTTGPSDRGVHVVCATMTDDFLAYTEARGNDLSTPSPRHRFPGLKPGDRWCLCASRWGEALEDGVAPPVILEATHARALDLVERQALVDHGEDAPTTMGWAVGAARRPL